jgi:23S rRNA (cytidine1920-2'-O)/16S rRNA (cytidine1409-2'-O)-methyltransferase
MRADVFLVEQGYAKSRSEAQASIKAGLVRADGAILMKPSQALFAGAIVEYQKLHPFVSRGGAKLQAALEHFVPLLGGRGWTLRDAVCLDIGASTGGFTHALSLAGAAKIYAVDVGHGQMNAELANSGNVVVIEGKDARSLTHKDIPEKVDGLVADVSFIGLRLVLEPALGFVRSGGWLIALVKPQFEVGREKIGKGGIVRDGNAQARAVREIVEWIGAQAGWLVVGTMESPVSGGDGNREFFVAARKS